MKEVDKGTREGAVSRLVKTIAVALFAGFSIWVIVKMMPWFFSLKDEGARLAFEAYIDSLGFGGVFLLLGVQLLQIVVAVLPGEPIELIAGVMYGTWGGLAVCLVGVVAGSAIVFYAVRKLGYAAVEKRLENKDNKLLQIMRNNRKLETLIFILYFIPGTPKDILVYLVALTPMKGSHFLLLSTIARIPSVITSTFAGESFSQGKFVQSIIIFAVTGLIALVGIWANQKFIAKKEKEADAPPVK